MVNKRVRGALSCYVVDEYVLWSIRTRAFASEYVYVEGVCGYWVVV